MCITHLRLIDNRHNFCLVFSSRVTKIFNLKLLTYVSNQYLYRRINSTKTFELVSYIYDIIMRMRCRVAYDAVEYKNKLGRRALYKKLFLRPSTDINIYVVRCLYIVFLEKYSA